MLNTGVTKDKQKTQSTPKPKQYKLSKPINILANAEIGVGEKAWLVKRLLHKNAELSMDPQHLCKKANCVCAYDPSPRKEGTKKSLVLAG